MYFIILYFSSVGHVKAKHVINAESIFSAHQLSQNLSVGSTFEPTYEPTPEPTFEPSFTSTKQIEALELFYDLLNGSKWLWDFSDKNQVKWNFTRSQPHSSFLYDPCNRYSTWEGIVCGYNGSISFIQEIILINFGLSGQLEDGIFENIPSITSMDLQKNSLRGSLPTSLGKLLSLERLILSSNFLRGTIPDSLSNLVHVNYVELSNNSFSGTLPTCLLRMQTIYLLQMQLNKFSGEIHSDFGSLSKFFYFVQTLQLPCLNLRLYHTNL